MNHPFMTLWNQPSRLVVGLMSGTSADGVDAALTRITGCGTSTKVEQLGFYFQPFDNQTRQQILNVCGGDFGGSRELCLLGTHLGKLYAQAVRGLVAQTGIHHVDLIGCHGQTVYHIPEETPYLGTSIRGTLQIGDPSYLSEEFGCPVVSDFRIRDMAAGGLGAPLVPYTEYLLYRDAQRTVGLQNIGGIGNITVLPKGCSLNDVFAFDTGPGNMVMDALAARLTEGKARFDDGGRLAAQGTVNAGLLAWMMQDPYLSAPPPKTTGREVYGAAYVDALCAHARTLGVSLRDTLSTATRFTAECIREGVERFCSQRPERLIVGGGGSMNPVLLADIADCLPGCQVLTNEQLGLDSSAKEAVAFAVLANEALYGCANNAPGATGAAHGVVMGKISL